MDDSGITVAVDEAKSKIALAALNYIYGNVSIETWAKVVNEGLIPPWPLQKHLINQGLSK